MPCEQDTLFTALLRREDSESKMAEVRVDKPTNVALVHSPLAKVGERLPGIGLTAKAESTCQSYGFTVADEVSTIRRCRRLTRLAGSSTMPSLSSAWSSKSSLQSSTCGD